MNLAEKSGSAKVLIVPWHRPSLASMARLYELYAAQERLEPCLLATSQEIADVLRGLVGGQAQMHDYYFDQGSKDCSSSRMTHLFDSALYRMAPSWISDFRQCRRRLKELSRLARAILEKASPDLLVVEDDRRLGVIPLVSEARRRGCKILVVPYGISSTKKDLVVDRQGRPAKLVRQGPNKLIKKAIATIRPDMVAGYGEQEAFFYRADEILALRSLSMLPPDPFVLGGLSDLIIVGGRFDYESLAEDGVSPDKLVVAGELEHDELARYARSRTEIRNNIIDKYSLPPGNKMVVVCIPQIQNEQLMSLAKQKEERRRLVRVVCGTGRNVLLSLHPRLDPSDCLDLAEEFPVVMLEEKLKEVIAAADFYISNHSSTVRWSIMLRIPTLVIDFNGCEEKIFINLSPALRFCNMSELFDEVTNLLDQPGALETQQHHQKMLEGYFGRLDGRVGKRVIDTTFSLLADGRAQVCGHMQN